MKKKFLLIIYSGRFTNFDYQKWELKELKKKYNLNVLIHVVDSFEEERFKNSLSKPYKTVIYSRTIKEWLKFLSKFNKKNTIIINQLEPTSFKTLLISYFLNESKIPILENRNAQLSGNQKLPMTYEVLTNYLKTILLNPVYTRSTIKYILIRFLMTFINYESVINLKVGNEKKKFISKKSKILQIHSWDYTRYLKQSFKSRIKKSQKNNIIFLDKPGPDIFDDHSLSGKKSTIERNTKKWYDDLNIYLDKIEKLYKTKVIIIPHPKVKGIKKSYYKKKLVNHENDAAEKLIPASKFIITCGITTAISYAILSRKPIVLTYCDQDQTNLREMADLRYTSKITGAHLINRNDVNINIIHKSMKINKTLYKKYKYKYLTSKNCEKNRNFKLIGKYINEN